MSTQQNIPDTVHLYQFSSHLVPGSVYWHGDDYPSFSEALSKSLQHIQTTSLKNPLELVVHLRKDSLVSPTQLQEWISFYCAEQIHVHTSEYVLMKSQGYKFLWKCLFLLWLCLTGAYAFDQLNILGEYSQMLGRETFFFLGWVFLWKPIEMIVFEPWSVKHQLRLINKLKNASFSFTSI